MTCKELAEFLDEYVAETLESSRRAIFDQHLAVCPDCRAYLSSYRRTMQLGRQVMSDPDSPATVQVPAEMIKAVLAARAAK
jgi:anti-sigma factor RsiW